MAAEQVSSSNVNDGAGAAFWEYTYVAGRSDENQVYFIESTWTNIIQPAARDAVQSVLSGPAVANCVPGNAACTMARF